MQTNRRTIIKSAGAVAALGGSAGMLVGCSSEDGGEATPTPTDATLPATDVPVGSGTVIDKTYVVTQPKQGEFHAFTSVCTHQGCQVKDVTEKEIICPCHGSRFSATTGEVVIGPAGEPLKEFPIEDDGGTLTISSK